MVSSSCCSTAVSCPLVSRVAASSAARLAGPGAERGELGPGGVAPGGFAGIGRVGLFEHGLLAGDHAGEFVGDFVELLLRELLFGRAAFAAELALRLFDVVERFPLM